MATPWKLELEGKGRLTTPDGVVRELPYRHVADLLAILADARPNGHQREWVAQLLWSEYPREERLTNLRQALSRLRAYVGADMITADRSGCRLEEHFPLEVIGAVSPSVGGFQREWAPTIDAAHSNLLNLQPTASFEWIRAHIEEGIGLPQPVLKALVAHWSDDIRLEPDGLRWLDFWSGYASLANDLPRSGTMLARSHRAAKDAVDVELTSVSGFWLGINYILSGNLSSAERIGKRAEMLIPERATADRRRILNLQAHVLLHSGRSDEALALFDQVASWQVGSPSEQTSLKALQALYLTYAGRYMAAERLLSELEPAASTTDNQATGAYLRLTKAALETLDLQPSSLAKAEALAERFKLEATPQLELYTRELLAVRAQERSSLGLARSQAHRIKALRRQLGLAYTQWDFQRLTPSRYS